MTPTALSLADAVAVVAAVVVAVAEAELALAVAAVAVAAAPVASPDFLESQPHTRVRASSSRGKCFIMTVSELAVASINRWVDAL